MTSQKIIELTEPYLPVVDENYLKFPARQIKIAFRAEVQPLADDLKDSQDSVLYAVWKLNESNIWKYHTFEVF